MVDPNVKELYMIRKRDDGTGEIVHVNVDMVNKFVIRGKTDRNENITMVTDIENLHFLTRAEAYAYLHSLGITDIEDH